MYIPIIQRASIVRQSQLSQFRKIKTFKTEKPSALAHPTLVGEGRIPVAVAQSAKERKIILSSWSDSGKKKG